MSELLWIFSFSTQQMKFVNNDIYVISFHTYNFVNRFLIWKLVRKVKQHSASQIRLRKSLPTATLLWRFQDLFDQESIELNGKKLITIMYVLFIYLHHVSILFYHLGIYIVFNWKCDLFQWPNSWCIFAFFKYFNLLWEKYNDIPNWMSSFLVFICSHSDLGPHETFTSKHTFMPRSAGEHRLVACFTSRQLVDIVGQKPVNIQE